MNPVKVPYPKIVHTEWQFLFVPHGFDKDGVMVGSCTSWGLKLHLYPGTIYKVYRAGEEYSRAGEDWRDGNPTDLEEALRAAVDEHPEYVYETKVRQSLIASAVHTYGDHYVPRFGQRALRIATDLLSSDPGGARRILSGEGIKPTPRMLDAIDAARSPSYAFKGTEVAIRDPGDKDG